MNYAALSVAILKILKKYDQTRYLYISPAIPPRKMNNSRQSCKIPKSERILGLIDCTFFGSAKNALVFGEKRIYFHSSVRDTVQGEEGPELQIKEIADNLGYDRFADSVFKNIDTQVQLGVDKKFNPDLAGGEWITGILDGTFWGSAAHSMVFGEKGIYFTGHLVDTLPTGPEAGEEPGSVPVTGKLAYDSFPSESFRIEDGHVEFYNKQRFDPNIAEIEPLIRILKGIRREMIRGEK